VTPPLPTERCDVRRESLGIALAEAATSAHRVAAPAFVWSGKLFVCPNEMVPLQIGLAIGPGRYRFALAANPICPLVCAGEAERGWNGRRSVVATT
jgi:hypothetical protein